MDTATHTPTLHIACPNCGAKNRVPRDRLAESPDCGNCGTGLMQARPMDVSSDVFDRYVAGTELPIVVDCWAA
ncbi:MAG: hypothetical protein ABW220_16695 [Burkholderiaceae bacterium]